MPVRTCDHLKEDGVYCGSPALNGRNFCYFHLNLRGRRLKSARARRRGDNPPLNLPFPEDMHAVQLSLAEIMWALAEDRIDTKRAGLLLYMLQQASTNLNNTPRWEGQREAVPSGRPLRALNDPNFEKRFGLPNNLDLDADPEGALLGGPQLPSSGNCGSEDAPQPPSSTDNWQPATDNCSLGGPQLPSSGNCGSEDAPRPPSSTGNWQPATDNCSLGGPQLPSSGNCGSEDAPRPPSSTGNCQPATDNCSLDRVPVPQDELKELQMTRVGGDGICSYYRCHIDRHLTDEEEHQLKLTWLRLKRKLAREQYLEAQRTGSEDAQQPMDGPEMNDSKTMPFGFCNTCEIVREEEEADDEAA